MQTWTLPVKFLDVDLGGCGRPTPDETDHDRSDQRTGQNDNRWNPDRGLEYCFEDIVDRVLQGQHHETSNHADTARGQEYDAQVPLLSHSGSIMVSLTTN